MGFSHAPHWMMWDDMLAHAFVPPVMFSLGIVFFIIAAGGVLVGWGLMHHERWARMTAIVIGILVLFHPPFGTALGIYTLWVLLPADAAAEYDRMSQAWPEVTKLQSHLVQFWFPEDKGGKLISSSWQCI
jgi:hypothetical protein